MATSSRTGDIQIFALPLSDDGTPMPAGEGQFLNLPIPVDPYILRFVVFSSSSVSNQASLWCNAPPKGTQFDRNKFYEYPINAQFNKDCFVDVTISSPGTYSFYITHIPISNRYFEASNGQRHLSIADEFSPSNPAEQSLFKETYMAKNIKANLTSTRKYYFTVSCGFEMNDKPLPLNSLAIESVISKWMGPYETRDKKLQAIKAKGYNMVHFTPLQPRGASNSPYSIFDQLGWDPVCFPKGEEDVADMVQKMEQQHKLLSLTDIVFNHTSFDSEWLREHPESGYSVKTAPHLLPALELEDRLTEYSGQLEALGLPADLKNNVDLDKVIHGIEKHVLQKLRLWEFYVVDVECTMALVNKILSDSSRLKRLVPTRVPEDLQDDLRKLADYVIEEAGSNFDKFGNERFLRAIDAEYFVSLLKALCDDDADDIQRRALDILNEINSPLYAEYDDDCAAILDNLRGRARFTRLEKGGPQLGTISKSSPIQEAYFTKVNTKPSGEVISLVNNGFIWNGDPMIDFASAKSRAYLRRDVIPWGDCVKLRYGECPADSPYLWERMTKYTEMLAKYFHGFRIDNCHSTPIHVGEYFLDKARLVRPDLYVAAELFTGSELKDKVFVERLGITSLIREAMQAWSVGELSRLIHKHGGRPIGSFSKQPLIKAADKNESEDNVHLVRSSPIHALFMDCTHDNETPSEKRCMEDALPTGALVAMCACAVGSTMGYDECYPRSLNIVQETRKYDFDGGFGDIKAQLYEIHSQMGMDNAEEMFVHHEGQYITVHRVDPKQGLGWFLIARSKFKEGEPEQDLNPITLKGTQASFKLGVSLQNDGVFERDEEYMKGTPNKLVELDEPDISYDEESQKTVIRTKPMPPGSIVLLRTWQTEIEFGLDKFVREGAVKAAETCGFLDLNVLMYRCDAEERDVSGGKEGVYNIPGYGSLTYAGLRGWISPLIEMISKNNMGHPICENLRNGHWALDYTVQRLYKYREEYPNIQPMIEWLESRFDRLRRIPTHLLPRYFASVVLNAYIACRKRALALMPDGIANGTYFLRQLALTSVQLVGKTPSASIFPFESVGAMAAGLPHFSTEYMRCWGRDVFLAFRGLLIIPGRYEAAKQHLLAFAATLKHGLIPNLLDSGRNPRYNARDATWFFLEQVQIYCQNVPDGMSLLDEKVKRRFPLDDTYVSVEDDRAFQQESTISEIIYEILSRHAKGIKFREANAGPDLDRQMSDEGFNQEIFVDWKNGFVFGGNQYNCGTWMDKMGESEKAGNKGVPGTPRDGAAIEIIGLLKSALRWVVQLHEDGHFEYDHVVNQHGDKIRFKEWDRKVQRSFEKAFYIPTDPRKDVLFDIDSKIVHRRGIYKDLYRSGKPYEDYQLRPNFAIAMCVAPELFNLERAWEAIGIADQALRGPVGMATLDPADLNYRPNYINGEDSTDFATSKGRNYHQGPEWVWCQGFFFRAMLLFDLMRKKQQGGDVTETFQQIHLRLAGAIDWINTSPWAGLTELTNKNGSMCDDSSPTQAWSSALLIELFEDARQYLNN